MKKLSGWRRNLAALGTALVVVAAGAGVVHAVQGSSVAGTTDHTLYKVGRTLTISGTVNGDVICAGQTVTVDATVNGDVICAAQTVTLNGKVNGDIRLVAQTITMDAQVERSASLAGQDVVLSSGAAVGNDLGIAANTVTIDGTIGRDVSAAANSLMLSGRVGRDANVHLNKLTLINKATIAGNLDYTAPNRLFKDSGVTLGGRVTYHQAAAKKQRGTPLVWRAYFLAAKVFAGLVVVALLPQLIRRWHGAAAPRFGLALAVGFGAMFAIPVVIIGLVASLIGIPLAIFLLLACLAAALPSAVLAMYFVGNLVLPKAHPLLVVLAGGLLLGILEMLPWVGFGFFLAAVWYGTGALLLNLKRAYKRPNYAAK